jgi:hypothetical protein
MIKRRDFKMVLELTLIVLELTLFVLGLRSSFWN